MSEERYSDEAVRCLGLPSELANGIMVEHEVGSVFTNYKQGEKLGGGTFAGVWMVTDREGRQRAGKLLAAHLFPAKTRKRVAQMFLGEVKNLARSQCPGVVKLYSVVSGDDGYLLVQEYVRGTVWAENLCQTELDAFEMFAQLLQALLILQERRVVHRDLKPTNILREGRRVVVADFGWSDVLHRQTRRNEWPGTLEINPPEVLTLGAQSEKVDNYALGMNLLLFVTGRFICRQKGVDLRTAAQGVLRNVHGIRAGPPPRGFEKAPQSWLLFRMLTKSDPAQRPALSDVLSSQWVCKNLWQLYLHQRMEHIWHPALFKQITHMRKNEFHFRAQLRDQTTTADTDEPNALN